MRNTNVLLCALLAVALIAVMGTVPAMATTIVVSPEGLPYVVDTSVTGLTQLSAFSQNPAETFNNPGFNPTDPSWVSTTITPTYAIETGLVSALLMETLDMTGSQSNFIVDFYGFGPNPASDTVLADAYYVTITNGTYINFGLFGDPAASLAKDLANNGAVPEPATMAMVGGLFVGLAALAKNRRGKHGQRQ